MSDKLIDLYTEEALRKILKVLYPTENFQPNEAIALEVYKMLEDARQCTSSLNKIKPFTGGPIGTARTLTMPAIKYIKSTLRKASEDKYALACIKKAAVNKRSEIYMLSF